MSRCGLRELACGHLDLDRAGQQLVACRRHTVPTLPLVEERQPERVLERGDAACHRGLTGTKHARGRQRAALARDGDEVSQVVPVEHRRATYSIEIGEGSAILQNGSTTSLLPRSDFRD